MALIEQMRCGPIELEADRHLIDAPREFFKLVLGPRLKFSACYWPEAGTTLEEAEEAALDQVAWRARIEDGQQVLELGCGWGALSLYLAEKFPHSSITAVCHSRLHKEFIEGEAQRRKLENLRIVASDMNRFQPDQPGFDRVLSVEMFEHMRNWDALLQRAAAWTAAGGLLFVHVFAHHRFAYPLDSGDWMKQHLFAGGIMPSDDLLLHFQDRWVVARHWAFSGEHYQRTAEAWLANLDRNRNAVKEQLESDFGRADAARRMARWRVFLMACAELFGYEGGTEWCVSHYLMERR